MIRFCLSAALSLAAGAAHVATAGLGIADYRDDYW